MSSAAFALTQPQPLAALPAFALPRSVVIVAPHPDDETLALGGTLQRLQAAGCSVLILLLTCGERSHPEQAVAQVIRRRASEFDAALNTLRVRPTVRRLGLPDAGVERVEEALAHVLHDVVAATDGATLIAPHPWDVHRDHRAAGRSAVAAATRLGVPLLHYAVWLWDRGDSRHWDWDRTVASELTRGQVQRKAAALDCYASQIPGVVPADVLSRHLGSAEFLQWAEE